MKIRRLDMQVKPEERGGLGTWLQENCFSDARSILSEDALLQYRMKL